MVLNDSQWERIKDFLPSRAEDCDVTVQDNRRFAKVALWIAPTGSLWRNLPEDFGQWQGVYVRYNR